MLDRTRAAKLAAKLDVHVHELPICLPCLSFVAFPLDSGDERELRRATLHFTPILWEEGLAEPARQALERARLRRVKDADRAPRRRPPRCALLSTERQGECYLIYLI